MNLTDIYRPSNPDIYRPSNHTEGDMFYAAWCALCERERPDDDDVPHCPILAATMAYSVDDPQYPREWTFDDITGKPACAAFVPAGQPLPVPRCEHTAELFPATEVVGHDHPCRADGEMDHEWEFVDDSFDHEYGTERVHYWRCARCDGTREIEDGDYDDA